jgi:hypothetical protein
MVSTRELRADYKSGPLRWQSQNRRAARAKKDRQFEGFPGEVALGRLISRRLSASRFKFCALFSSPNSEFLIPWRS